MNKSEYKKIGEDRAKIVFVLEVTMGIPKSPQAHTEVLKRSPGGAKIFASPPNYGYERENTIP